MPKILKVMVSVSDESMAELRRVVAGLREAGMQVDQVLEPLGTVAGSIAPDAADRLMAVPGVESVEWQQELHIPPEPQS